MRINIVAVLTYVTVYVGLVSFTGIAHPFFWVLASATVIQIILAVAEKLGY